MMKRVLSTLGIVLMMALVSVACKKKNEITYPPVVTSGVWSGGNASTGYTCDVTVSVEPGNSENDFFILTVSGPDQENTGVFIGTDYTYNASTGTIALQLIGEADGAPSAATLQYNPAGDALAVSFTSASVDFGNYIVTRVTYPASIAGDWISPNVSDQISLYLSPYALNGGLRYHLTRGNVNYMGVYTYDATKGEGGFTIITGDTGKLIYNHADGTLTCTMSALSLNVTLVRNTNPAPLQ